MSCNDCKDRYRCPDRDKAISVHCGAYDKTPAKFTGADPRQEELKPCPFCGEEAELEVVMGFYKVRCTYCSGSSAISTDEDEAISYWNRRAGSDWVALHDSLSKGMADLNEQCRRAMAEISQSIRAAIQRGEE